MGIRHARWTTMESCLWGMDVALFHIARHPGKRPVLLGKAVDADVTLYPSNCNTKDKGHG